MTNIRQGFTKMTNREFYNAIINNTITAEVTDFAKAEIDKLNARNDKRRNTPTKEQIANEGIKTEMLSVLANGAMVASEISAKMGISTQKVTALAKQLVEAEKVVSVDVKIKGKGTVKQYRLAE